MRISDERQPIKTEPTADMRQAAAGMWQIYTALTDQGFTEGQALQILGAMLAANALGGQQ